MARIGGPKKSQDDVTIFRFKTEEEIKAQKSALPYIKARQAILESPQARSIVGQAILAGVQAMAMRPVQSNAELEERLADYFQMAAQREIPPTVEEMSLYCGYTYDTIRDWQVCRNKGFDDAPYPGATTSNTIKKALNLMHQIDAVLTESGKLNTVAYIFRSKNFYGMQDKQEISITAENSTDQAMTPEEIAARLPDPDADYSVE